MYRAPTTTPLTDRSGSMSGDRIALAKTAGRTFVDMSRLRRTENGRELPGDEVGVVGFAASASVVAGMSELVTSADKDAKKTAIGSITADGSTGIGGGLRTSLNELTGSGALSCGCIETIVLLSDGHHNTGESPASEPHRRPKRDPPRTQGVHDSRPPLAEGSPARPPFHPLPGQSNPGC